LIQITKIQPTLVHNDSLKEKKNTFKNIVVSNLANLYNITFFFKTMFYKTQLHFYLWKNYYFVCTTNLILMNLNTINKALYHKNNKSLYIINAQNIMCKQNDFTSTSLFTPKFKFSNTQTNTTTCLSLPLSLPFQIPSLLQVTSYMSTSFLKWMFLLHIIF